MRVKWQDERYRDAIFATHNWGTKNAANKCLNCGMSPAVAQDNSCPRKEVKPKRP